jgi:hypothetical protein
LRSDPAELLEIVLRLQNVLEGSDTVTVDLATLFPTLSLAEWRETTLALDDEGERVQWGGGAGAARLTCKGSCGSEVIMVVVVVVVVVLKMMRSHALYNIIVPKSDSSWTPRHQDVFASISITAHRFGRTNKHNRIKL